MKKHLAVVLIATAVFLCSLSSAFANSVNVTGDVKKNDYLTINVDWTADTSKYKGLPVADVRKQIRNEMWEQVLPKLVEKTKAYPISYDDSQFVLLEENTQLLNQRADGSKLYNIKLKIKFSCTKSATATTKPTKKKMDEQFKYRFQVAL